MPDAGKTVNIASQIRGAIDACQAKAFICFGTLLFWVRDRRFNIDSDIDIGFIGGDPNVVLGAFSQVFSPVSVVRDDVHGMPLNANLVSDYFGCSIDLYFWRKKNGMYYHCFDRDHVHPANGVLPEYEFKGVPAECFDAKQADIEQFRKDLRYSAGLSPHGTWLRPVPQCPEEGVDLPLPYRYGECLDHWYPDWFVPRDQYGVSECAHRFTVTTCKGAI